MPQPTPQHAREFLSAQKGLRVTRLSFVAEVVVDLTGHVEGLLVGRRQSVDLVDVVERVSLVQVAGLSEAQPRVLKRLELFVGELVGRDDAVVGDR